MKKSADESNLTHQDTACIGHETIKKHFRNQVEIFVVYIKSTHLKELSEVLIWVKLLNSWKWHAIASTDAPTNLAHDSAFWNVSGRKYPVASSWNLVPTGNRTQLDSFKQK